MTVKKLACSFAMASDHTARACVAGGGGRATQNADAKPCDFQRSQRLEDFNRSVFTERPDGFVSQNAVWSVFDSSRQVLVGEHRGDALEGDLFPRFARAQVIQRERASRVGVAALRAGGQ